MPADLPLIRPETQLDIPRAPLAGEVLVPVFAGPRGHPVRFAPACGHALAALQGHQGAAPVVSAREAIKIVVNDPGCISDIDTLDDLQRAERLLRAAS